MKTFETEIQVSLNRYDADDNEITVEVTVTANGYDADGYEITYLKVEDESGKPVAVSYDERQQIEDAVYEDFNQQ